MYYIYIILSLRRSVQFQKLRVKFQGKFLEQLLADEYEDAIASNYEGKTWLGFRNDSRDHEFSRM